MPLHHYIPDYNRLIQTILARGSNKDSQIHGIHHWMCVATIGYHLLIHDAAGDPIVVLLFALFHDSMRVNDWDDPDHGRRGGLFAHSLQGDLFTVSPDQLHLLLDACNGHTNGGTISDPTIGICWDSDRLNLWRIRRRPAPYYLSTAAARQYSTIEWAKEIQMQHHNWETIFSLFDSLS